MQVKFIRLRPLTLLILTRMPDIILQIPLNNPLIPFETSNKDKLFPITCHRCICLPMSLLRLLRLTSVFKFPNEKLSISTTGIKLQVHILPKHVDNCFIVRIPTLINWVCCKRIENTYLIFIHSHGCLFNVSHCYVLTPVGIFEETAVFILSLFFI